MRATPVHAAHVQLVHSRRQVTGSKCADCHLHIEAGDCLVRYGYTDNRHNQVCRSCAVADARARGYVPWSNQRLPIRLY